MNKNLFLFVLFILISGCSFDSKTGIWGHGEKEKERISELEKQQKQIININKVYSSDNIFSKEIVLKNNIKLSKPKKNLFWEMSSLNYQNSLGNIYLSGIDNTFLKKKIGKNKFSMSNVMSSPLVSENFIILSDDKGTIYKIDQGGKVHWKKNIYKKIYKKIYKNLVFSIYNNKVYIADNIGFIYSINLDDGKLIWIKNHGIPLKSNIKIFKDKIFLINQDNRIVCLNVKNGTKIWDIRAISSFIKSQNFLSTAITNDDHVVFINSSGDLIKTNLDYGKVSWSANTSGSMLAYATDFFKSSNIVIFNDELIISTQSSIFSYDVSTGFLNWEQDVSSVGSPIIDGDNIFIVTENGYFVIIDRKLENIISSNYILKILKKKKRSTVITGFIMGSGKIYSVTLNGYLIVSSAVTGKVESFKKIGDPIISPPVISDGKLYILTKNSRIIGLN
tara:strand:+ start:85 stop:1428 length:1344 start_codon:yes stop_codon:yes gene_type:complete